MVAVLVAGGFPTDVPGAARAAAIVLGGGLIQTLLVVIIWPLRRFSVERRTIAAAYRALASYASQLPRLNDVAPEPHTFAAMTPPERDPQPFARPGDVFAFQALFDEGSLERQNGTVNLVRPLDSLRIPPTVQAILAARIDRLHNDESMNDLLARR